MNTQSVVALHARSPFDALASLACSGQALGPLVKARAYGMTPHVVISNGDPTHAYSQKSLSEAVESEPAPAAREMWGSTRLRPALLAR